MNLPLVGLKDQRTEVTVGSKGKVTIGAKEVVLMGGPCAVESREQMQKAAKAVKAAGGKVIRGGVYKPRTSPYSFQGLGAEGLEYLAEAAAEHGLLTITEVMDARGLELLLDKVDILQIGSRNMQNFDLLKLIGQIRKPVVLKRGLSATVEEWLNAAEYILAGGNNDVILCERGIRTYEPSTRNTLDLSAVSLAKELSHLPVIVDPSHAAGRTDLIPSLAKAAVAVGADGLLIEMHPNPAEAKSDGAQSLTPEGLIQLAAELRPIAQSIGRRIVSGDQIANSKASSGQDSSGHASRSTALSDHASGSSLESLRASIDGIDKDILQLLGERMKIVKEVAKHKSPDRIRDGKRESEIIERLSNLGRELGCPRELVAELYNVIFDYSIRQQLIDKAAREAEKAI